MRWYKIIQLFLQNESISMQILTWGCRQTTTEVAQRSGQALPALVLYDHSHWNIEQYYAYRTIEAIQSQTINLKKIVNIGKCYERRWRQF